MPSGPTEPVTRDASGPATARAMPGPDVPASVRALSVSACCPSRFQIVVPDHGYLVALS